MINFDMYMIFGTMSINRRKKQSREVLHSKKGPSSRISRIRWNSNWSTLA